MLEKWLCSQLLYIYCKWCTSRNFFCSCIEKATGIKLKVFAWYALKKKGSNQCLEVTLRFLTSSFCYVFHGALGWESVFVYVLVASFSKEKPLALRGMGQYAGLRPCPLWPHANDTGQMASVQKAQLLSPISHGQLLTVILLDRVLNILWWLIFLFF